MPYSRERATAKIIGVAIWPVFLGLACILRIPALGALALAGLLGIAAFFFSMRRRQDDGKTLDRGDSSRRHRSLGLGFQAIIFIVLLPAASYLAVNAYYWITWDPIGTPHDAGWGNLWPFEDAVDSSILSEQAGTVVTLRQVTADFFEVPPSTFVFIHQRGENDEHSNLVFRYEGSNQSNGFPATATWTGPTSVTIHVWPHSIGTITKQLTQIGNINITYDLGPRNYHVQLDFWQRPFF